MDVELSNYLLAQKKMEINLSGSWEKLIGTLGKTINKEPQGGKKKKTSYKFKTHKETSLRLRKS